MPHAVCGLPSKAWVIVHPAWSKSAVGLRSATARHGAGVPRGATRSRTSDRWKLPLSWRPDRGDLARVGRGAAIQFPQLVLQVAAPARHGGVGVVRPLGAVDAGERRLQRVVLRLPDRVELVVVAAGAADRQPREGAERRL